MSFFYRSASLMAWLLVACCAALPARAALIVYEGFDYAAGDLRNENGGTGDWTSIWAAGAGFGSGNSWQVAQPSLSYTDSGGRALVTNGGAVTAFTPGNSNIEFRDTRRWDTAGHKDDGDVLWFSYLFNRSSGATSDLRVNILGDGGLFNDMGVFISSANTVIAARISANGAVETSGHKVFTHDEDHFVVGRITFSDTMDDEVRYWLDPELNAIPLDTAPNSGAVTAAVNASGWHNFYMRKSQFPGLDMVDEIRIGTDFFSVAPSVPGSSGRTFEWNVFSGNFAEPDNWNLVLGSGAAPPGIGDTAVFNRVFVVPNDVDIGDPNGSPFGDPPTALDKIVVSLGDTHFRGRSHPLAPRHRLELTTGAADLDVVGGDLTIEHLGVTVGDRVTIRGGSTLTVGDSTSLTTESLSLADVTGAAGGTLIVRGSFAKTGTATTNIGVDGGGTLTFEGAAVGNLEGVVQLASEANFASIATLNVLDGAEVTIGELQVAPVGIAGTTGMVMVADDELSPSSSASLLTLTAPTALTVRGGAGLASGIVTVSGGGRIHADGAAHINGAVLNINENGFFRARELNLSNGYTLDFDSGTIRVTDSFTSDISIAVNGTDSANPATFEFVLDAEAATPFSWRIGNEAGTYGRTILDTASKLRGTGGGAGADMIVGGAGNGRLEVHFESLVSFRDDFIVAEQVGSVGTVLVHEGSSVEALLGGSDAAVSIGHAGVGVLEILAGGKVQTSGDVFLAPQATGSAIVTVAGLRFGEIFGGDSATLKSGDELFVGGNAMTPGGAATLTVEKGGHVIVPNRLLLHPSGTVHVDGGRLDVGSFEFQGGTTLDFTSGTVHFNGDATLTPVLREQLLGSGGVISAGRTISVGGTATVDFGDRLTALEGAVVGGSLVNNGDLDVIDGTATFAGPSTNSGDINAIDSTLTFSGGLNSTGQVNLVNTTLDGQVMFGGTTAVAGVAIFAADVSGRGNFRGSGLARFEAVYSPGASPAVVTFEGSVEFSPTSTLVMEVGGTTAGEDYDQIQISGALTLDGTLQLKFVDGFAPQQGQQFELLDVGGTGDLAGAVLEIQNLAPGFEFDIAPSANGISMTALNNGVFLQPVTWNVDADGDWSSAANWTAGNPNAEGVSAHFHGAATAPRIVTVDAAKSVTSLTFDNVNSYTLAGPGPLHFGDAGNASIQVTSGQHEISAPISIAEGRTLSTRGFGALSINGTQTHGAGAALMANARVTNLNSDGGTNLSVHANGSVNFGATQHLADVRIGEGGRVTLSPGGRTNLVTGALSIVGGDTPTGTLDLTDNAAIIDYPAAEPNPEATIRAQIIAGRGGSGLGKTWNGQGITSSTAAAAAVNSMSVGYAVNGQLPLRSYETFRGETVDATSVLMVLTRTADANLDGVVNNDDVAVVGANYAPDFAKPRWDLGDFDYDGFVDNDDITLLGAFYNPGATPIPAAAVPEPATAFLLASGLLLAGGLRLRRRVLPGDGTIARRCRG